MQLILFGLFKVLFSFLVCTNAVIDPQKIQELGNTLICGGLASLSLTQTQNPEQLIFTFALLQWGRSKPLPFSVNVVSGVWSMFVHFMSGISTVQRSGFA